MVVFTDGWVVLVGGQRVRTGATGKEGVVVCSASPETGVYTHGMEARTMQIGLFQSSFTVPWSVTCEPLPRHSIIAALRRQPEWKAWEKKRLQGKA